MPADGPVIVRWQSVYAAIPVMDIYSAYHIRKLRLYLLVMLCTVAAPQIAIEVALFGDVVRIEYAYTEFLDPTSDQFGHSVYVILWIPVGMAWSIVLIRHWSIRWNADKAWR